MEIQNLKNAEYSSQSGIKTALASIQESNKSGSGSASEIQKKSEELDKKSKQEELKKELMKLTEDLNKEMNPLNINVRFGFEDRIGEMFVSVFEKDSNKLLRKIPSDEAINLMTKMREIIGIIFDKKA